MKDLKHKHIVGFVEMPLVNNSLAIVMEYIHGFNAAWYLRHSHGPLPVARAVGWICQALDGLAHAHALSIIHRDIKPSNLIITERDENGKNVEIVKVVDFGLACCPADGSTRTLPNTVAGSWPFMAPEQRLSLIDGKAPADQFAAAATLYNLLTNEYVYPNSDSTDIVPIRLRRPDIPRELADVIDRGLAPIPEDRYEGVQEFRAALLEALRSLRAVGSKGNVDERS